MAFRSPTDTTYYNQMAMMPGFGDSHVRMRKRVADAMRARVTCQDCTKYPDVCHYCKGEMAGWLSTDGINGITIHNCCKKCHTPAYRAVAKKTRKALRFLDAFTLEPTVYTEESYGKPLAQKIFSPEKFIPKLIGGAYGSGKVHLAQRDEVDVDPGEGEEKDMNCSPAIINWGNPIKYRDGMYIIGPIQYEHTYKGTGADLAVRNDPIGRAWNNEYSNEAVYFHKETGFWLVLNAVIKPRATKYVRKFEINYRDPQWSSTIPEVRNNKKKGQRYVWLYQGGKLCLSPEDYRDLCTAIWAYQKAYCDAKSKKRDYHIVSEVTAKHKEDTMNIGKLEEGEIAVAIFEKKSYQFDCPTPGKRSWAPQFLGYCQNRGEMMHQYVAKSGFILTQGGGRNGADAMSVTVQCQNCGMLDQVMTTHGVQQELSLLRKMQELGVRDPNNYLVTFNKLPSGKTILRTDLKEDKGKLAKLAGWTVGLPLLPLTKTWQGLKWTGGKTKDIPQGVVEARRGMYEFTLKHEVFGTVIIALTIIGLVGGAIYGGKQITTQNYIERCKNPINVGDVTDVERVGDYMFFKIEDQAYKRTLDDLKSVPKNGRRGFICANNCYHDLEEHTNKLKKELEEVLDEAVKTKFNQAPEPTPQPEPEPEGEDFRSY